MGIKRNFVFSTVLTVANYIFPFIIYPYVSRVLGVNNIGICNFVDSIINYAVMISMMGVSIVGVRDIAKVKGDKAQLSATFTSLLTLCTIFTLVATIALVTLTFTVDQLYAYRKLLVIGIIKLWSNFLLIDWLYRGLEDFRYITIRTILVKIAYLICVFMLVHQQSDYVVYYLLTCLMVTANAAFNCYKAFSKIRMRFDWQLTRKLTKSNIILGIYLTLNSMYTTFNVVYLGLKCGDTEVGYYTTATKIFYIILAIYTAYSGVVMPRASAMLSENRIDEFKALIGKSMKALILMAVPVSIFGMLYSPGIIYLIAGPEYTGAILPFIIAMPLIFVIGYEQILSLQILTPISSDRVLLTISVIGASVGVIGNIALVNSLGAVGSAIVWSVAEITVLASAQYYVTKKMCIDFPALDLLYNIFAYIPFILISIVINQCLPTGEFVKMLIGGAICTLYFFTVQVLWLKDELVMLYYRKMLNNLFK